jgi:hypothetical protein
MCKFTSYNRAYGGEYYQLGIAVDIEFWKMFNLGICEIVLYTVESNLKFIFRGNVHLGYSQIVC